MQKWGFLDPSEIPVGSIKSIKNGKYIWNFLIQLFYLLMRRFIFINSILVERDVYAKLPIPSVFCSNFHLKKAGSRWPQLLWILIFFSFLLFLKIRHSQPMYMKKMNGGLYQMTVGEIFSLFCKRIVKKPK